MKEPWQMTEAEWNEARDRVRPCVAQSSFTKASGSQATANMRELERLLYGVKWEAQRKMNDAIKGSIVLSRAELQEVHFALNTPVAHRDVLEKARREGLLTDNLSTVLLDKATFVV